MSTYNYEISKYIFLFQNSYLKGIQIKITSDTRDFRIRAETPFVKVHDDITVIDSFKVQVAGNGKEVNALFTIDAFESLNPTNYITFGYGEKQILQFENVNINANISELIPPLDQMVVLDADNDWFDSLTD